MKIMIVDGQGGGIGRSLVEELLGLAICAQIVKLHKGSMKFESEEGKGTKVTLRLKLVESIT